MPFTQRMGEWLRPFVFLGRNPLSLFGAALATGTGLTVVAFWGLELLPGRGLAVSPYAGIVFYLVLPTLFVLGLLLIPTGALLHRRRLARAGTLPSRYPRIDLNDPLLRRAAALVLIVTLANVVILSAATYKGVQYMDSTTFCGSTCHSVMEPEYTTYRQSSHARIACVDCHVGPGPTGFLRAKLGGVRQTLEVTFGHYPRPIRPARLELPSTVTTCESCHNRWRWIGERLVVRRHYDTDAANTEQTSVLVMHVGGVGLTGPAGIHGAHLGPGVRVEYTATDASLQTIAEVRYTDTSGRTTVYRSSDTNAARGSGIRRQMECVDCHNRVAHKFLLPSDALDEALARGAISPQLPFVKREALAALQASYPSRDAALKGIRRHLEEFYRTHYPDVLQSQKEVLEAAIAATQAIYAHNIFPAMNIGWGTYPDQLGHVNWPGCFRCHDGNHSTSDGRTVTNDCSACHNVVAMNEHAPKILSDLNLQP